MRYAKSANASYDVTSAEILHQHQIASELVPGGIEYPLTIRRNREANGISHIPCQPCHLSQAAGSKAKKLNGWLRFAFWIKEKYFPCPQPPRGRQYPDPAPDFPLLQLQVLSISQGRHGCNGCNRAICRLVTRKPQSPLSE